MEAALLAGGPVLFAASFAVAYGSGALVAAVLASSAVMASLSLLALRGRLLATLRPSPRRLAAGALASLPLYAVFQAGGRLAGALGLGEYVGEVYSMVDLGPVTAVALAAVSVFEEVYWRGAVQEVVLAGRGLPWWLSSVPYSLVHAATGNPVLVAAALVVGLYLGLTARLLGVAASAAAHYAWLLLVFSVPPQA